MEANAGCKHFDVHGGPEDIPVSRFSFDAKVNSYMLVYNGAISEINHKLSSTIWRSFNFGTCTQT